MFNIVLYAILKQLLTNLLEALKYFGFLKLSHWKNLNIEMHNLRRREDARYWNDGVSFPLLKETKAHCIFNVDNSPLKTLNAPKWL